MKRIHLRGAAALALSLSAVFAAGTVAAQAWPAKPITLIVAYPAGGDSDVLARVYAEKLSTRLGQPVIVDNKPGASGTLGASFVAKAHADGYTLLFAPSTFAIAPLVLKGGVPMDVVKDFTPVVQTGSTPLLLLASPQSGIKDVKGLVAQIKGGKDIAYGSPGAGSPMQIVAEMFNKAAGVTMAHVPYKGTAPALTDALGGHIPVVYTTPGAAAPYLAGNKLTPLAVTDRTRSPLLPNVPTLVELGYKDVDVVAWWGVFGPKGLPADVVAKLNTSLNDILKMPDVVSKMATMGAVPSGGDAARLGNAVSGDFARYGKIVKEFGIQAD